MTRSHLSISVFIGGLVLTILFWMALRFWFPAFDKFGFWGDMALVAGLYSFGFLSKGLINRYFYLD